MPSTLDSLFAVAELRPAGAVRWGERMPETRRGVYAVSLTRDASRLTGTIPECPLSNSALDELLRVRPELRVDGARPSREELGARLAAMWLGDEVIVYVGLAGSSLQSRAGAYYRTPLGARRPHAGGWPLKTLSVLDSLWVHFAPCDHPDTAEQTMLDAFAKNVSSKARALLHDPDLPLPFANLERAKGQRQRHGITGAREPQGNTTGGEATPPRRASAAPRRAPARSQEAAPAASHAGPMRSQRITEKDIQAGRIRFPSSAKRAFPPDRAQVDVELRGHELTARWHPRYDHDQERSGVLSVGRQELAARVMSGEVLSVGERAGCVILS